MKKSKIIAAILVLALMISVTAVFAGCNSSNDKAFANAYITVDINPSIEIVTDEKGMVSTVTALNDDAALLLCDLQLVGKSVDEAMQILLAEAKATGYIIGDDKDAILVNCVGDTKTEKLETILSESVDKFVKESKSNIDFLTIDDTDPDIALAAQNMGVTVAKYKLITLAMKYNTTLTLEAAKTMAVRDLNKIVTKARQTESKLLTKTLRDEYEAEKNFLEATEEVQMALMVLDKVATATESDLEGLIAADKMAELQAIVNSATSSLNAIDLQYIADNAKAQITDKERNDIMAIAEQIKVKQDEYNTILHGKGGDGKVNGSGDGKGNGDGNQYGKELGGKKREIQKLFKQLDNLIDDIEDAHEEAGLELDIEIYIGQEITISVMTDIEDIIEEEVNKIFSIANADASVLDIDFDEIYEHFEDMMENDLEAYEDALEKRIEELEAKYELEANTVKENLQAEKHAIKNLIKG